MMHNATFDKTKCKISPTHLIPTVKHNGGGPGFGLSFFPQSQDTLQSSGLPRTPLHQTTPQANVTSYVTAHLMAERQNKPGVVSHTVKVHNST